MIKIEREHLTMDGKLDEIASELALIYAHVEERAAMKGIDNAEFQKYMHELIGIYRLVNSGMSIQEAVDIIQPSGTITGVRGNISPEQAEGYEIQTDSGE